MTQLFYNRYELGENLGSGGMGTVYRAFDRLTGAVVALKRVTADHIPPEGEGEDYRLALSREFRLLASLRHPNIISVLDYGFDAERYPYYTMELLPDPQTIIEAAHRLSLEGKVNLLVQTLQALAYLHRRGILHRDLKPANILVLNGTQVRVLDFGLSIGRDEQQKRQTAGTLAYMAPETLRGKPATTATDLYAVGILAYELFSGNHPFDTAGVSQLVNDVLNTEPDLRPLLELSTQSPRKLSASFDSDLNTPLATYRQVLEQTITHFTLNLDRTLVVNGPVADESGDPDASKDDDALDERDTAELPVYDSERMTDIDVSLAAIIYRLLQKNPDERLDHAPEVMGLLCAAVDRPLPTESAAIRESFLQAAQFIGRDQELQTLTEALATMQRTRKGSAWLIGGESGVGKSRLVEEVRIRALTEGLLVLRGQGVSDSALPYQLWQNVLRSLLLAIEIDDLDAGIIQEFVPGLSKLLGRPIATAPPLEGRTAARRLMMTVARCFRALNQPAVLLLEDLQWVNESLDLLEHLISILDTLPLLIIGSYRDDETPDLPDRLPGARNLSLERFSAERIAELSASMLGMTGRRPDVVNLLERETEGNVFFIVEVVRALAEEAGSLGEVGRMTLPDNVFTGGVQQVIERRLARMPEAGLPLLNLAAIAGRQVDTALLAHCRPKLDAPPPEIAPWLEICVNTAIMEVQEGQYQFSHDKLRETILKNIPDAQRPALHRYIAEALEALHEDTKPLAQPLADHWRAAGNVEKEIDYTLQAAEQLQKISKYSECRTYLERILPLNLTPEQQRPAYHLLGMVYHFQSDYEKAKAYHQKALEIATTINDGKGKALAHRGFGMICREQGNFKEAVDYYERSMAISREIDDRHSLARTAGNMGVAYFYLGNYEDAMHYWEEALQIARDVDDQNSVSVNLMNLGNAFYTTGDYEKAHDYWKNSLEKRRGLGDRHGVAAVLNNLGLVADIRGDYTLAQKYLEESLAIMREVGDRHGIASGLSNLGEIAISMDDPDTAAGYIRQALDIQSQIGDQNGIGNSLNGLAVVNRLKGEWEQSREYARQSLQTAHEIGAMRLVIINLLDFARIAHHSGDLMEAATLLRPALAHPACDDETRQDAQPLQQALQTALSDEQWQTAADAHSLETIIEQLLKG